MIGSRVGEADHFGGKKNLLITLTFSFYTYKMREILIYRKFHKAVMRLKMVLHKRNLYYPYDIILIYNISRYCHRF